MIKRKIDPSLLKVSAKSCTSNNIDCLVYSNNYVRTKRYLDNLNYCKILAYLPFINAFAVNVCPEKLSIMSSIKHINYITSQARVFAQVDVAKKVMNVQKLQEDGLTGKGVTIAFIDTGICSHLDFVSPKNRILIFKDFVNFKQTPYDDNGHGTFVASVALGNGMCSAKKYAGIAPNANIISLKTLDNNGETGAFTILEAMQWVHENYKKYNIKVVCMSFGSQPMASSDPLTRGAETLWDDGIVVVAAAGNSGPDKESIKSPGVSTKIITVGALDDKRTQTGDFNEKFFEVADFSSRGPAFNFYKPDLVASGVNLTCCSNKDDEFYTHMSGTSVATPLIAGLSALIIEKMPTISPVDVKTIILNSCKKINGDRNVEGFGYFRIN